jgi:hypothetical protein
MSCVCDATACSTGCCLSNLCNTPAFPVCGVPSGTCTSCDMTVSDRCTPSGGCQCGQTGAPCPAGETCTLGACGSDAGEAEGGGSDGGGSSDSNAGPDTGSSDSGGSEASGDDE